MPRLDPRDIELIAECVRRQSSGTAGYAAGGNACVDRRQEMKCAPRLRRNSKDGIGARLGKKSNHRGCTVICCPLTGPFKQAVPQTESLDSE